MSTRAQVGTSPFGDRNREQYRQDDIVDLIRARAGWIDAAEKILVNRVADEARSQPILDIGVGGGRTAWMLRPLSSEYIAADYSPEMVEACRREYPGLDVRECDARDLSMFADGTFALVVFSFNGIDVLDHGGRTQALNEIHRVLRPGGLILYSTGNKNGALYGSRPWAVGRTTATQGVKFLLRLPFSMGRYARTYRNWWQRRRSFADHGSWAICTSRAYEFRLVVHWTLPSTERRELGSIGFAVEETLAYDGSPVRDDTTTTAYFYVLARKTEPATP
jgi:SAM-dependent methyltransferase